MTNIKGLAKLVAGGMICFIFWMGGLTAMSYLLKKVQPYTPSFDSFLFLPMTGLLVVVFIFGTFGLLATGWNISTRLGLWEKN